MDIKILYKWLKEYIHTDLSVQEFAKKVSQHGISLEKWEYVDKLDDYILNIEVTPNRVDMASVIGIAREASAILKTNLSKDPFNIKLQESEKSSEMLLKIQDVSLCKRYQGLIVNNVQVTDSPNWLKERIESSGFTSINNIVDLTNYILLEYGQPVHAFDLDKIEGNLINVRRALNEEDFVAIGGSSYKLNSKDIVIADAKKVIAIAGVKGGQNTEVTSNTKNIFVEFANFDPISVRKTSRNYSLITDASLIFEKGIHPYLTEFALARFANLVEDVCGGQINYKVVETSYTLNNPINIILDLSIIFKKLGINITKYDVLEILSSLGFTTQDTENDNIINVLVPFYRENDIQYDYDLVEEIARIYGYNNIPNKLINTSPISNHIFGNSNQTFDIEDVARTALKGLGFYETYTYSFISESLLCLTNSVHEAIKISNPLSSDFEYMRTNLVCSLLKVFGENEMIENDIKLFEISNVYLPTKENALPTEELRLAMLVSLSSQISDNFYYLRSCFDYLAQYLNFQDGFTCVNINNTKNNTYLSNLFDECNSGSIMIEDKVVGVIGILNFKVKETLNLKKDVAILEINFAEIVNYLQKHKLTKKNLNTHKFPSVFRDLSFVVPVEVNWNDIQNFIYEIGGSYLVSVSLFDIYQGKNIPDSKKSISFTLEWNHPAKTLSDNEINSTVDFIISEIEQKFKADLRK